MIFFILEWSACVGGSSRPSLGVLPVWVWGELSALWVIYNTKHTSREICVG
jgi:hypothetical protein